MADMYDGIGLYASKQQAVNKANDLIEYYAEHISADSRSEQEYPCFGIQGESIREARLSGNSQVIIVRVEPILVHE